MTEQEFHILLERYITGQITESDRNRFLTLLEAPTYEKLLERAMQEEWDKGIYEEAITDEVKQRIEERVITKCAPTKVILYPRSPLWQINRVAVAAVLLIIAGATYLLSYSGNRSVVKDAKPTRTKVVSEIVPGSNKAFLVLASGDTLTLHDHRNGIITHQGAASLRQERGGTIVYEANKETGQALYNTVYTPKGGQYHVVLADGSNVWLNAGSFLRFPSVFTGSERNIQVSGEAYFEVTHDSKRPFKVEANKMEIIVLGTRFNINAYHDDSIWRTTLVQGKVQILNMGKQAELKPGNQAQVGGDKILNIVNKVDTQQVMAWKNGTFQFKNAEIQSVMKQLSRWYDIEVIYEQGISKEHFTGTVSRTTAAIDLLRLLNASGIRCQIIGRKLIIKQ